MSEFYEHEKIDLDKAIQLKDDLEEIEYKIKKRWSALIGFGCGYFQSWEVNSKDPDTILIHSQLHDNTSTDIIHKKFFLMHPTKEDRSQAFIKRKATEWRIKEEFNIWHKRYQEEKEAGNQKLLSLSS